MGFKKYRGIVNTVETAMMAHRVLDIRCLACRHRTNCWAYKINQRGAAWGNLPLNKPVRGFYCRSCKRSVLVILRADGPWDR
jgi:hypothetical protein